MNLYVFDDAARYCNLPVEYFKNQYRRGHGPAAIKPSPRKVLFLQRDLDDWVKGWATACPAQLKQ